MDQHTCTLDRFRKDVSHHVMTVLRDDGLYRHVRFKRPETSCYQFDLVTWPGHLAISGDMGSAVFTRLPDMFEFFRPSRGELDEPEGLFINPGYWAEKCEAACRDGIKAYAAEEFHAEIRRRYDEFVEQLGDDADEAACAALWERIESEVLSSDDHESEAHNAADGFRDEVTGLRFHDFWECDLRRYTFRFIWQLYAIAWGIKAYDAGKAKAVAA